MITAHGSTAVHDPIELLNNVLEQVWHNLCCTYDASADLPDLKSLFNGPDLSKTFQISEAVLANMLLDVMENIGRFSPWYTRPARAFGLIRLRNPLEKNIPISTVRNSSRTRVQRWMLAPEAVMKWQPALAELSEVIEATYPLIQAMLLVENLMDQVAPGDTWITARCGCAPPREIQVTQAVLNKGEILCDACYQKFRLISEPSSHTSNP